MVSKNHGTHLNRSYDRKMVSVSLRNYQKFEKTHFSVTKIKVGISQNVLKTFNLVRFDYPGTPDGRDGHLPGR